MSISKEEAREIAAKIPSEEARNYADYLGQDWSVTPKPSFRHVSLPVLWRAEQALQRVLALENDPDLRNAFVRQIRSCREALERAAGYLRSTEHPVGLVGAPGVGKTTVICTLAKMRYRGKGDDLDKEMVLQTGGGRQTLCEVHVRNGGKVGVIAPHGVLFRGGAEGRIRKALIEENLLDAVIGLPEKLFFGTGIPAVILLFKKGRKTKDVLFTDASGEYVEGTNQNRLGEEQIKKIVATYRAFETVPKYSYRATREEIAENDFNLNIPRYVDTFEPETPVDLMLVQKEIDRLEIELAGVRKQMAGFLKELGG